MSYVSDSTTIREQRRGIMKAAVEPINVISEEQHAFKEGMKLMLNSTWMSSAATRETIVELFPSESLVTPSFQKLPLLFYNFRDVLRFCGIIVEQRQGLYIPQAVVNATYSDDAQL